MKPSFLMTSIFLVLSILCTCVSCQSTSDTENCQNSACTLEFVTLTISLEDQNGTPVVLDDFSVTVTQTNQTITLSNTMLEAGTYPLIEDGALQTPAFEDVELHFVGYINSSVVFSEHFIVENDCCHIRAKFETREFVIPQ